VRSQIIRFSRQPGIPFPGQHEPVFSGDSLVDPEGLLNVEGYFSTIPQATIFKLTYLYEKPQWKLPGINLAMRESPEKNRIGVSKGSGREWFNNLQPSTFNPQPLSLTLPPPAPNIVREKRYEPRFFGGESAWKRKTVQ